MTSEELTATVILLDDDQLYAAIAHALFRGGCRSVKERSEPTLLSYVEELARRTVRPDESRGAVVQEILRELADTVEQLA